MALVEEEMGGGGGWRQSPVDKDKAAEVVVMGIVEVIEGVSMAVV